jgi:hypothetical protein
MQQSTMTHRAQAFRWPSTAYATSRICGVCDARRQRQHCCLPSLVGRELLRRLDVNGNLMGSALGGGPERRRTWTRSFVVISRVPCSQERRCEGSPGRRGRGCEHHDRTGQAGSPGAVAGVLVAVRFTSSSRNHSTIKTRHSSAVRSVRISLSTRQNWARKSADASIV